jgi:tetratricopeptide (TPR) repeat protein
MLSRIAQTLLAFSACAVAAGTEPPRYLASRELSFACRTAGDTPVGDAELYVSTDAGRTWEPVPDARHAQELRFTAAEDGRYEFYFVLHNAAGASGPAPTPGTRPALSVEVDTTPPLVQVHRAELDGQPAAVLLAVTLVEENLAEDAVRLFFRATPADAWTDGGPVRPAHDGRYRWAPPPETAGTLELRVVAADRAGNQSAADPLTLELPSVPPGTQPAAPAPPDAPLAAPPTTQPDPHAARDDLPRLAGPELAHLRELAQRFMRDGQYVLAAARYEDALALTPADPDLLVDLGSALYRANRYDTAQLRFDEALTAAPDHVGALEGLALVAATQKRYAQAREYLQRLQQLQPDSASVWLRSGDVEHKLGHAAAARNAWERVLQARTSDPLLRAKAQRRLEYFGAGPPSAAPSETESAWPVSSPQPRPSSSSSGTNSTRSLRP